MARAARYAYLLFAWLYLAAFVVQVFFIGLGLFASPEYRDVHATFGYIGVHLTPLLILIAAALGRVGREQILLIVALAVVVFFVPIFATLRNDLPVAAALHPVAALFAFWLAILVARRSLQAVRAEPDRAVAPTG